MKCSTRLPGIASGTAMHGEETRLCCTHVEKPLPPVALVSLTTHRPCSHEAYIRGYHSFKRLLAYLLKLLRLPLSLLQTKTLHNQFQMFCKLLQVLPLQVVLINRTHFRCQQCLCLC